MISKEDFKQNVINKAKEDAKSQGVAWQKIRLLSLHGLIEDLYDSIGSCGECSYGMNFEEMNAPTRSIEQWTDCKIGNKTHRLDFFCAYFERKKE